MVGGGDERVFGCDVAGNRMVGLQGFAQNAALNFKEAPVPSAIWLIPGFGLCLWLRCRKGSDLSGDERHDAS